MGVLRISHLLITLASIVGIYALWCGYSFFNRAQFNQMDFMALETFTQEYSVNSIGSNAEVIQIRKYPSHTVVEAPYKGIDLEKATDLGLEDIGAYLLGKNSQRRNIQMTIPFSISATSSENAFTVSFALTENGKTNALPLPSNKKLRLKEIPTKLMACLQWKGSFPSSTELSEKVSKLRTFLNNTEYEIVSEFVLMQYDSPYSPGWMRKNELLYEVRKKNSLQIQ